VAFLFSLFLAPPIIAVRQEGALDAVLDTIDLMRGKGAFWVAVLVCLASFLLGGLFLGKTFDVGFRIANATMGGDFRKTVAAMPDEIKPREGTLLSPVKLYWPGRFREGWLELCRVPGVSPRTGPEADLRLKEKDGPPGTEHRVAGWILGVWVLIMAGFAISFTLGAFVSAGTLTYLIVREEEEFLEPAAVETPPAPKADEGEKKGESGVEKPEENE
jgi:hypothetical protein